MSHTISIPAFVEGPKQVPYPAAFERAKKSLKALLRSLTDAKDEFVLKLGARFALTELARQVEMYARREGPFGLAPNSNHTLSWWRVLSESSDAPVLAVRRL
jgi:hypothetical protein